MSSRFLTASQQEPFPKFIFLWLIMGYEATAVVCLLLMLCFADARPAHHSAADAAASDLQPWHRFLRRNIKLFGIVSFYFAIFVFNTFRLVANWTCVDAWTECAYNDKQLKEDITDGTYPVVRTVYLCVLLIFCIKFNASDFCQSRPVLAGLAVVQAANLSGWLNALVDESAVLSSKLPAAELSGCINVSAHFDECFRRDTDEYRLLRSVSPYIFPFIMEYLMLVIECVADWFFGNADTAGSQRNDETRPRNELGELVVHEVPSTSYGSINTQQQHQQPRRRATAAINSISLSDSDVTIPRDAAGCQDEKIPLIDPMSRTVSPTADKPGVNRGPETLLDRCPWFFVGFILSLIASFLFVTLGIYNFVVREQNENGPTYHYAFVYYRSGYWLALSLAALVGYAASRTLPSHSENPSSFENLVTLSCVGPIMQSVFSIVDNLMTCNFFEQDSLGRGTFFEHVIHILQICIQVMFYAHAKSIQIRIADASETDQQLELGRKRSVLTGVMSYFVVCNFCLWVENSFIEIRNSENSWQIQYFQNWPLIYDTLNPLSLLFRFNSALLFLDVLLDKRR